MVGGIRLMKMIQDIWCYNFRVAVISNDGHLDVHVSVCLEKTDINVKGTGHGGGSL